MPSGPPPTVGETANRSRLVALLESFLDADEELAVAKVRQDEAMTAQGAAANKRLAAKQAAAQFMRANYKDHVFVFCGKAWRASAENEIASSPLMMLD